jgi:hypothetical protein
MLLLFQVGQYECRAGYLSYDSFMRAITKTMLSITTLLNHLCRECHIIISDLLCKTEPTCSPHYTIRVTQMPDA